MVRILKPSHDGSHETLHEAVSKSFTKVRISSAQALIVTCRVEGKHRNIPKVQHRNQTHSHVDERPRPRTPDLTDPDACCSQQADIIHQSSIKTILHKLREGGPEKTRCEFAAFGHGAAGVAGKSFSPGDASFSTLLANSVHHPQSVSNFLLIYLSSYLSLQDCLSTSYGNQVDGKHCLSPSSGNIQHPQSRHLITTNPNSGTAHKSLSSGILGDS
jgi:hypothetical protein